MMPLLSKGVCIVFEADMTVSICGQACMQLSLHFSIQQLCIKDVKFKGIWRVARF